MSNRENALRFVALLVGSVAVIWVLLVVMDWVYR